MATHKDEPIIKMFEGLEIPNYETITVKSNFLRKILDQSYVFYVEDEYDVFFNELFEKNYDTLLKILSVATNSTFGNCYKLIYIPRLRGKWQDTIPNLVEVFAYYFPHYSNKEIQASIKLLDQLTTRDFSKTLFNFLGYKGDVSAGLLNLQVAEDTTNNVCEFSYVKFNTKDKQKLLKFTWWYRYHLAQRFGFSLFSGESTENLLARLKAEGRENEIADLLFDNYALEIAEEIKQKISSLKVSGYNQLLLNLVAQQISAKNIAAIPQLKLHTITISRLVVTQDFKIFLTGFNNLEITMTPLPKALFLLFLRYPAGIYLKEMPDYQKELLEIYKQISYRETPDEMLASIKDVTNPAKNSINEKCSRIKEAFVRHFDDSIAKHYYITGERGKRKSISLNRDLVEWQ